MRGLAGPLPRARRGTHHGPGQSAGGLGAVIVYNASTGTALASSRVTPFRWVAILSAWTVAYGARHKKKGERLAAGAAASEAPGTSQVPPSAGAAPK